MIRHVSLLTLLLGGNLVAQAPDSNRVDPGPAPYVRPPVGMVTLYSGGLAQRVDSVSGMRVRYTDGKGRPGALVGLFVMDSPIREHRVDTTALAGFWPLAVGKQANVQITVGAERWETRLRVTGTEEVSVPAGKFKTYVIEGVQAPRLVANPWVQTTVSTWWYAPQLGSVVRFVTTSRGSPVRYELLGIRGPANARGGSVTP